MFIYVYFYVVVAVYKYINYVYCSRHKLIKQELSNLVHTMRFLSNIHDVKGQRVGQPTTQMYPKDFENKLTRDRGYK
jgi:hypothetical protein